MHNHFPFSRSLRWLVVAVFAALELAACTSAKPPHLSTPFNIQEISQEVAAKYVLHAMMSANAYHDSNGFVFPLQELGWQLVDLNGNPTAKPTYVDEVSGLAYDFYEKQGSNEVIMAFRGSDGAKDWFFGNFQFWNPLFPNNNQYNLALEHYRNYLAAHNDKKIIALTGHSLGGGLALSISLKEGIDAFTFDTSPNTDNFFCGHPKDAHRVIFAQKDEVLHYLRLGTFPCLLREVPLENRYQTQFDFSQSENFGIKPVDLHNSGPLAMGMLQLAAQHDTAWNDFCDKFQCGQHDDLIRASAQTRRPSLAKRLRDQYNWDKKDAHEVATLSTDLNVFDQIALAATAKDTKLPGTSGEKPVACLADNDPGTVPAGWDELLAKLQKEGAFTQLAKEGADRGLPLDETQRKQAWELLVSGRAETDVRQSIYALLKNLYRINPDTLNKTFTNETNPFSLIAALAKDAKSLNETQQGKTPVVLGNTLHTLQSEPLGEIVSDTVKIFTGEDNPTMRLAIIAYARMNGFNLTEDNLNDLNKALDKNQPDLYPLLAGALDTMKQQYGVNDAKDSIKALKSRERNNANNGVNSEGVIRSVSVLHRMFTYNPRKAERSSGSAG